MAIKLARTPSSAGNQKIFTFSTWYKRSFLANGGGATNLLMAYYGSSSRYTTINFDLDDTLEVFSGEYTTTAPAAYNMDVVTLMKFRDVNSWYHIVVTVDTTQATNTDRVKIWVNGVLQSVEGNYGSIIYPTQNSDLFVNSTIAEHYLCSTGQDNRGYMAHTHYIDGTAYDASAFGQFNSDGVWKPKTTPSVTYGTNGFFMKYENSSNFGTDSSPNGNTLAVTGTPTQTVDTPTNVFCTMNPLNNPQGAVFSNGNLKVANTFVDKSYGATLAFTTMPVYWEVRVATVGNRNAIGIIDTNFDFNSTTALTSTNRALISVGNASAGTSGTHTGTVPAFSANDIICFAWDGANNKLYYSVNANLNTASSNYFTIAAAEYTPAVSEGGHITGVNEFNFGNGYFGTTAVSSGNSDADGYGIFEYSVPTGYYALCTKNIATYG